MFCQIRETDTRDSRLEAPSLMGSDSSSPEQVPRLSGKRLGPMGSHADSRTILQLSLNWLTYLGSQLLHQEDQQQGGLWDFSLACR